MELKKKQTEPKSEGVGGRKCVCVCEREREKEKEKERKIEVNMASLLREVTCFITLWRD